MKQKPSPEYEAVKNAAREASERLHVSLRRLWLTVREREKEVEEQQGEEEHNGKH